MPKAVKVGVEVRGIKQLLRKLRSDELLADDWRQALDEAGRVGRDAARAAAPKGPSGRTAALMTYRVSAAAVARYVVVKTTAVRQKPASARRVRHTSARGHRWTYPYPYPRRLEFDPGSRHRDWLKRAIEGAYGRVQQSLQKAAGRIEARWGR